MVNISPGIGLNFARDSKQIRLDDSISKVLTILQDSLSIFGTIKLVVPEAAKQDQQKSAEFWVFLV